MAAVNTKRFLTNEAKIDSRPATRSGQPGPRGGPAIAPNLRLRRQTISRILQYPRFTPLPCLLVARLATAVGAIPID